MKFLPFLLSLGTKFSPTELAEVSVETKPSPPKGLGVFATRHPIKNGTFVCQYKGDLLTLDEQEERYPDSFPDYCLRLSPQLSIDAERSDHWSRFINHNERANLKVVTQIDPQPCAYFEAIRNIEVGEELSFDYGPVYFYARGIQPAQETESRVVSFLPKSEDEALEKEEEVWRKAGLPDAPMTSAQIQEVLSPSSLVSDRMKKAAFVRALDYFGAVEWIDDDLFTMKFGKSSANDEESARHISYSSIEASKLATSLEEIIQKFSTKK